MLSPGVLQAQDGGPLAEKLGYEKDAKLLIVHADDIGLSQSTNQATIRAFESGGITSGSVMVPCPWFPDFAAYYREHPGMDVGIHITLTAEWDHYKWGGISSSSEIQSLLDPNGYFYPDVEQVALNADPCQVEREIRAQIERALSFGIRPSHLDTHMGSVAATPELIQIYFKLGKEYDLPVLAPSIMLMGMPREKREEISEQFVLLDRLLMMQAHDSTLSWGEAYGQMLEKVVPGLNQLIVHLSVDNAEMQAVAVNHPAFGSAWRQRDLDFVTSREFKEMLKEYDIQLVSWEDIRSVM